MQLKELGKLKKISNYMGCRNRDLPVFNLVAQPTTLPRAPKLLIIRIKICIWRNVPENLPFEAQKHVPSYRTNELCTFQVYIVVKMNSENFIKQLWLAGKINEAAFSFCDAGNALEVIISQNSLFKCKTDCDF
jgi:hypothetical protein